MATVTVSFAAWFQPKSNVKDIIIIAHNKNAFANLTLESSICKAASISTASDLQLLTSVALARLSPSKDNGSSAEIAVGGPDGEVKRIVLAALPMGASRHNAPSRSHAVCDLVKSNKGSSNLTVLLIPADRTHMFAQICAASRPFPQFDMKSKSSSKEPINVDVVVATDGEPTPEDVQVVKDASYVVDGIRLCQRLVDTPPNILHTDAYVEEALQVAAGLPNTTVNVISGKRLEEEGFGGIWGVGKASEHPPALVILSLVPEGTENDKSVCLVGKGIVFDTGGLSIKVPPGMCKMKSDMGGSGSVLGAFMALARSGTKVPVHALLCIAENSVGPIASRPDDIHTFLSGKTVELNNTDAEGRLVLADGVYYAANFCKPSPQVIIDIATLTGAQMITTGRHHASLYCSDGDLESVAVKVGQSTGDLAHPVIYCPEFHRKEFASSVADMKNSVADRANGQVSCAGQFIGNHLEDYLEAGGKWCHVDMAGPSMAGERATGYGVGLLFGIVKMIEID